MPPKAQLDALNLTHTIPGIAEILPGQNNLPKIRITTPAARAEIYLHGAQITSWQPANHEEVLFLSRQSRFEEGKAIRGGIPLCFPWFRDLPQAKSDNPKAPAHGLVRTKAWQLDSIAQQAEEVVVTLSTESDESTRLWFPHNYRATLQITVGAALQLHFTAKNTGDTTFQFEAALHTYNRVGDVQNLTLSGLDQTPYLDNRDNNAQKLQSGDFHFTRDTDNAYLNTQSPVDILDPVLNRRIRLEKQNSLSTVVWNPWAADAAKLADLGDDEWTQFACVEAANILSAAIPLHPGEEQTTTAHITVHHR